MRKENKYNEILDFICNYGAITAEIASNLFYNTKYGKDSARRSLNKLVENGFIKRANDIINNTFQYYDKTPVSNHKLQLLRFYSYMVLAGAEILEFNREYKSVNAVSDALIIYKFNGKTKIIIVEVDISHKTKNSKYEKVFESGYFQKEFGTFPRVFILDSNAEMRERKVKSDRIRYEVIDYDFEELKNKL